MVGLRYIKAPPTAYLIQYQNGKVIREGAGRSFWYYAPTSTIVIVPTSSVDVPFAFEETSNDFQVVTVQGQLTYRIMDAKRVASLLDFSVNAANEGVIFSDGIEADFLQFNSGAVAHIGAAQQKARLVI